MFINPPFDSGRYAISSLIVVGVRQYLSSNLDVSEYTMNRNLKQVRKLKSVSVTSCSFHMILKFAVWIIF